MVGIMQRAVKTLDMQPRTQSLVAALSPLG